MVTNLQLELFPNRDYQNPENRQLLPTQERRELAFWFARQSGLSSERAILFADGLPPTWPGSNVSRGTSPGSLLMAPTIQALRAVESGDTEEFERCCGVLREVLDEE
jgi:hypothetical protein